jgi:hypothetical protein
MSPSSNLVPSSVVSQINIPIDKRSGNLYETVSVGNQKVRVVFGVSDFFPVMVEKSE